MVSYQVSFLAVSVVVVVVVMVVMSSSTAARLEIGPVDEGANKTDNNSDNDNDNRIIHVRSKYRPQKQHEEPGRAIFVPRRWPCPPARRTACGSGLGWLFRGGMPSAAPPPAYLCRLLGTVSIR